MIATIIYPGSLPGLNEYTRVSRANKFASASMKKKVEYQLMWVIKQQCKVKFTEPVHVSFLWIEKNRKRDIDNIAYAKKHVLDALQKCGVLIGDGWKHVTGFSDSFDVDAKNPRIEVTIKSATHNE